MAAWCWLPIILCGVFVTHDIVTHMPIARQRRSKNAFATIEEALFSVGPPPGYISSSGEVVVESGAHRSAICTWRSKFCTCMIT
jgi:hypothetical protein